MKIGIYGNCQVASYKEAFRCKLPRATIVSSIDQYECADEMESCEIILLQSDYWDAQYLGKLRLDSNIKFVKIPNFYFPAFHPDLVIEHSPGGTVLLGPAGSYNSSIVIYGFLRGLSTSETIRLFDDRVFERLGFYSYEEASRVRMEQDLSSCGLDGSQIYAACRQLGCFMYSVNHPTLEAVRVVANAILNKYSLQQEVEVGESSDPLRRHGRWPVYPEIADKFGIKGNTHNPTTSLYLNKLSINPFPFL